MSIDLPAPVSPVRGHAVTELGVQGSDNRQIPICSRVSMECSVGINGVTAQLKLCAES